MIEFQDKIEEINEELNKRRPKWTLKAIPSIDFDDISQLIRMHVYKKWKKWDQSRPLKPWLNRTITNQIINILRNLYGRYSRPCLSCAASQGGDLCSIFRKQCSDCPLYKHWEIHRKSAYDTKLPLPLESHTQEVFSIPGTSSDLNDQIEELHRKMKGVLNAVDYLIYQYLYIDGKTDEETAKLLGYKTSEKNRKPGYKRIFKTKQFLVQKAREILESDF